MRLFRLLFLFFLLNAGRCTLDAPVVVPPGFDWQGHRGCRGLMPENTIPAFLKALDFPEVTTLELDLAVSKDSQLVLSHEPWFYSAITTLPNGDTMRKADEDEHLLYHLTLAEIQQYDVGKRGNKHFKTQKRTPAFKPTLQQVIDTIRAANPERFDRLMWNVEIKSKPEWDGSRTPPVDVFAQMVVRVLQNAQLTQRATVQSFDVRALQATHQLDPSIKIVFLVESIKSLQENLDELGFLPDIYSPAHALTDPALVKKCHEKGIKIIPWTINEEASMRRLIRMGVDGIITDYPDRIAAVGKR